MSERGWQILGLGLLIAGVAAVWIGTARRGADLSTLARKGFLLLAAFAIVGGFVGSTAWWADHPSGFSWDLPPLASRLLGAAAVAFGLTGLVVLARPTADHVRLYAMMIAIYLAPLTVAILLFHRDRFDFSAPITPAFFALVVPMTVLSLWLAARPQGLIAASPGDAAPPARVVTVFLTLVAAACGIWAIALFATDRGPSGLVWAWPGDLLTSRLIAMMPLTLAAAALFSRTKALLARTALVLLAAYGIGGAAAGSMNAIAGKPIPLFYVAALGSFGLAATALLVAGIRRRDRGAA
ncbi:MAG: hypothetical protein WAT70_05580 [Rhizobiaceae bacterium]